MRIQKQCAPEISKADFVALEFIHTTTIELSTQHRIKKSLSTTPPISPTPFPNNILNSSPIDFNAKHQANIELNAQLESYNEISTPRKKYINCPTRTVERQHAANSVYRQKIKEQGEVFSGRKHKLSGKRQTIEVKHMLTGEELRGRKIKRVQRRHNTCNKRVTSTAVDTTSDYNADSNSSN